MTSTDTTDSREMVALEIIDEPLDSVDEDFAADSHTDVDISDCSVEVSDEDDSDEDVSTFCEECKKTVLLNDKILRPYIKHTNKLGRIVRLDTAFGENAETEIHIGHVRYDTFPQLPVLVGSASRGCGFCALLKKVLATRVGSYEGRIGLHFSYKGSDCHGLQHHRDQSGLQGVGIFLVCVSFDHPNEEKLFESVDFNYKEDKDTHKKGKFRRGVCKENEKERDLVGESKEKEEETGEEKSGQEENIGVNWDERLELRFELESDQDQISTLVGLRPRPEKIALCEKNIGRIQAELDKSLGSCCPLDSPTPYTPTRLVDLGQNWDAIPHLIQPDRDLEYMKFPGKIRYAALSYCWGPKHEADQNIKTTKESVREFPTPLPLASMPQALKDAVEVCRSFSIRYLWVDTLCIFQGDLTDWEQESEKMAPIYQNAYLTICALASGSCLQGFLTRSPLSIEIPFHSKISGAIAGTYALTYRDDLASPIAGLTCLTQDLLTSKWNKRAWTFQEEKLSSRLLYFGKYRMHFSCKHQLYSENHPENMDSRLGVRSFIAQSDPKTSTEIASKAFYDDWVLLSAQYNKRILSHENDKLPALSGMAKYVGDIIQDEYVVGMWRKDLHRSLLWVRFATCETWSEFQENLACPSAANMPSWSWLSDNLLFTLGSTNSLLRQELNIFPDYTLHSVDIIHEGTNRFGRIESAVLKISGALLPVTCHFVAALTGRLWPEQIWQLNYKSQRVYNVDFDFSPEGKKFHPPEGLAMLKVAYCPSYTNDFGETTFQHAIWGLVLLPTQNPAEYRRIGIFSTHPDDPEGINPFKDATVRSIQLV